MGFWSGLADGVCAVGKACESTCRWGLNTVSGDARWGDEFYDGMLHPAVRARVEAMSPETIERLATPDSASDFTEILGTAVEASADTTRTLGGHAVEAAKEVAKDAVGYIREGVEAIAPDTLGMLAPLALGAGVLGGGYLLLDAFSGRRA